MTKQGNKSIKPDKLLAWLADMGDCREIPAASISKQIILSFLAHVSRREGSFITWSAEPIVP
jgi:hypothetical protein